MKAKIHGTSFSQPWLSSESVWGIFESYLSPMYWIKISGSGVSFWKELSPPPSDSICTAETGNSILHGSTRRLDTLKRFWNIPGWQAHNSLLRQTRGFKDTSVSLEGDNQDWMVHGMALGASMRCWVLGWMAWWGQLEVHSWAVVFQRGSVVIVAPASGERKEGRLCNKLFGFDF